VIWLVWGCFFRQLESYQLSLRLRKGCQQMKEILRQQNEEPTYFGHRATNLMLQNQLLCWMWLLPYAMLVWERGIHGIGKQKFDIRYKCSTCLCKKLMKINITNLFKNFILFFRINFPASSATWCCKGPKTDRSRGWYRWVVWLGKTMMWMSFALAFRMTGTRVWVMCHQETVRFV